MWGCNNSIISNRVIDVVFDETGAVEPVTLEEAKEYIRKDFPDDDVNILPTFITGARKWAEKITGTSIVNKKVTAVLELLNRQELPYGPVIAVTNAANYTLQGTQFPRLKGQGEYTIEYTAGYGEALPEDLKTAILAKIASMDENRGDEDKQHYSQIAESLAAPFNRVLWL